MKHNKLFFLSIIVLSLLIAGCRSSGDYFLDNLDRSVSPRTDFYQYVNGNWLKDHPLSPVDSVVTPFHALEFQNNARMFDMIDRIDRETAAPGSIEQKISGLFAQIMDTEKLDREGAAPIEGDLKRIAGVKERAELFRQIFELQKIGINLYFGFGTAVDSKNSSLHVWAIGQGVEP